MTETGADLADPAAYLAAALDQTQAAVTENGLGSPHGKSCGYEQLEFDNPCTCYIPEQTLALVAAHRQLLAIHVPGGDKGDDCLGCCEGMNRYEDLIYDWWPCPTIKLLARAYGWTEQ